jgi:thiol-disulfide isomerase/thioredoxin
MKKIICVLPFTLLCASVLHAQRQFSIAGDVSGKGAQKYYLLYNNGNKRVTDSAEVVNGKFKFAGALPETTRGYMTATLTGRPAENEQLSIFLEPTQMILYIPDGDLSKGILKGSVTNDENRQLEKQKAAATVQYQPLLEALRKEKDHDKAAAIREQLAPYFNTNSQLSREFILSHHNSYLSLFLMRFEVGSMTLDSAKYYFNSLNQKLQESNDGKEMAAEIKQLEAGSPGSAAYNFSKPDINGQPLSLADFRGKYVLVDFWASWCVPCRQGNPHLLELYKQYKEKGFEIISVSDDDRNHDAWKKAVEKDGIGVWKHVLRGLDMDKRMKNISNPADISEHFGIHSLPTQILIDPKGIIVARYGGGGEEHEALDSKLTQIFSKTNQHN